jgi:hypothetical protein
MTDRKKAFAFVGGLLALLILFYSRILFTVKIIRAPDIMNEYFWYAADLAKMPFLGHFGINLSSAGWDMYQNAGTSVGGGTSSIQFLGFRDVLYWLIPLPTSIAWYILLHLFFGAAGTYLCCRVIGASRLASLLGGMVFALAPEIASLINAGHVMKIATISFAPWAFYFLERGFQTRRLIFFLTTAFVLAFQFFNIHWQIAFYTCLCIGAYGFARSIGILVTEKREAKTLFPKLLGLNAALLVFFLTTVSISLLPLANWSKDTNRGVQSGANQPGGIQGGLNVDEAMSWSLPPEELATFIVPGMFGLSRQEGGENPTNIPSYYWGRMIFTQTSDYMGLLPWLLLPLPLIFRRDRYTWLSLGGVVGGILFSMGKYTPFYWALYKFFPGINHFRVPKMMMFIPVIGLAVLAARGIDLLRDEEVRKSRTFRRYVAGVCALPAALLVLLGVEYWGADYLVPQFGEMLSQPTRYEQGPQLVGQRWGNLVSETAIAAGISALYAAAIFLSRNRRLQSAVPWLLLLLFVGDTWRVNDKFLFLVQAPEKAKEAAPTPVQQFLSGMPQGYRILPMDGSDPMQYVSKRVGVMFTSNAVQQVRWQQFLDTFGLPTSMPDIMNVKYLVMSAGDYQQQKGELGAKFVPAFASPDGATVVLENRAVLPKAWLVPSVVVVTDPEQRLGVLRNPQFEPRAVAVVESPPPVPLSPQPLLLPQNVSVEKYEPERIVVSAATPVPALLVLGEKYYRGWKALVDGKPEQIQPVDHVLRGVYLPAGNHRIEFVFDPTPFKIGKWLTLVSFAFFAAMLGREWRARRKG